MIKSCRDSGEHADHASLLEEPEEAKRIEEVSRINARNIQTQESMQKLLDAEKLRKENPQTCKYELDLSGTYKLFNVLHKSCKSVQNGSDIDFLQFYDTMQIVEDSFYETGTNVKQTRDLYWKGIDLVRNECSSERIMAGKLQSEFELMGSCFVDVFNEFGEFPAMELGFP